MAGMTQKFGHEEISDGYLWYQWSEEEIAEYMDTVSSLNDAEDRAELGLISDAEPVKAGDLMMRARMAWIAANISSSPE